MYDQDGIQRPGPHACYEDCGTCAIYGFGIRDESPQCDVCGEKRTHVYPYANGEQECSECRGLTFHEYLAELATGENAAGIWARIRKHSTWMLDACVRARLGLALGEFTTITTGGVEHPVLRVLYHPLDQARDHRVRGIIRARFFL